MARPLSYSPGRGPALTLDDLSEFVADAYAKGFPGNATPRAMAALSGFSMTHGPLIGRLTLVPDEVSDERE